jgi:ech hydrogenase subunit A
VDTVSVLIDVSPRVVIYIDWLTLIMLTIVVVVGGLVLLWAGGYMQEYHKSHPEVPDRRGRFFAAMVAGLLAMAGLVLFSNLLLMFAFLHIISLCAFYLTGYTRTLEDKKASGATISLNAIGDLCFAGGVAMLWVSYEVLDFAEIMSLDTGSHMVMTAVLLIIVAGLVKAAQFPFSKWVLATTGAPAPALAMMHSVVMVKAGVYLIIRLAPMLGQNAIGVAIVFVGGLTFLVAAALAGSQEDARKVMAYSTASAMGLVIALTALNTAASQWAAIMLLILHAGAKTLLFMAFGTAEHQLGRDVEHMRGMHGMSLRLAMFLMVGMAGMLVAPFVMLVSRWPVMQTIIDSGNIIIVMIIAFGVTVTLFFWTKWLGKLIAHTQFFDRSEKCPARGGGKFSLYVLAVIVIVVGIFYPLVSEFVVVPFIRGSMDVAYYVVITPAEVSAILLMLTMLLVVPILLIPYFRKNRGQRSSVYMAGLNTGDDLTYRGAMGETRRYELRNRFMISFHERKFLIGGYVLSTLIILVGLFITLGGAFV